MSGWSVRIEQWDEDGFHGTEGWNTDKSLGATLRDAADAAKQRSYPDTRKLVITIAYMERPFLSTEEVATLLKGGKP